MLSLLGVGLFAISLSIANSSKMEDLPLTLKFHQNDYKLKYEWAEVIRYNKHYLKTFELHVFKYNRTCAAGNLTFYYYIDIGNELEIIVQAYKFTSSNDYRLFPIRFEVNFCDVLEKNLVGSRSSFTCGNFNGCPLKKGINYKACNWKPDEKEFPPFIPAGRYKIELQGLYHSEEMWLINAYGEVYRPLVKK